MKANKEGSLDVIMLQYKDTESSPTYCLQSSSLMGDRQMMVQPTPWLPGSKGYLIGVGQPFNALFVPQRNYFSRSQVRKRLRVTQSWEVPRNCGHIGLGKKAYFFW